MDYKQLLTQIQSDNRYLENLDWGQPRDGHPEGSIRAHIAELERNLGSLQSELSEVEFDQLRVLIHTHDTFKPNAKQGVAISDPQSHASLARAFLAEFTTDTSLLTITQFHDEPFALWKKHVYGGDHTSRLSQLFGAIEQWDLYLTFVLIDGSTDGKSSEPLEWFLGEVDGKIQSRVDSSWLGLFGENTE